MAINSTHGSSYNLQPVDSILMDIYRVARKNMPDTMDEDDIREAVYFASSQLYNHKYYENAICMGSVVNHNMLIPNYRKLLQVYWKADLNDDEYDEIIKTYTVNTTYNLEETYTIGAAVGPDYEPYIVAKYPFATSTSTIANNWTYAYPKHGIGAMAGSNGYGMAPCHITYSAKNCVLTLSQKSGYALVLYDRLLTDDEGNLLMPVIPEFTDAVRSYVLMEMHLRAANEHTQGSLSLYDRFKDEWEKKQAEVRAKLIMLDLPEYISMNNNSNSLIVGTDSHMRHLSQHRGPEQTW